MMLTKGFVLGINFLVLEMKHGITQGSNITRANFPKGFVFGTASSAYQYEGALKEDGRGLSIWDTFGKIEDFSSASVATNQYHLYPEDIQLMVDMGMDAYRFSIAWSRIFPNGTGEINQAGVDHYNNLINALLAKGIEPYVTLYHWDLPKALQDKYNGWLDRRIIKDYVVYAETCFQKFGDRVKHWMTFNEPLTFSTLGYKGFHAPGRCSARSFCKTGNSKTEPYIVAHNVLLSHATTAHIYRRNYKSKQGGSIGIVLNVIWYEPLTNSTEDIDATQRIQDFELGWFMDPLYTGDYPRSMKKRVGSRLPTFSQDEATLVKGSFDFLGINHYTSRYVKNNSSRVNAESSDSIEDFGATTLSHRYGKPIGERANSNWLYIVPRGIRNTLNYIKEKYGNPFVIISENGMDDPNVPSKSLNCTLKDEKRIKYHNDYLINLLASIKEDGCNVGGYFAWSLLDNWEWADGYTSRFGLYFVDFKDNLKRYPKSSAKWFKTFLGSKSITVVVPLGHNHERSF